MKTYLVLLILLNTLILIESAKKVKNSTKNGINYLI